jgi:hypothetical protein
MIVATYLPIHNNLVGKADIMIDCQLLYQFFCVRMEQENRKKV